MPDGSRRVPTLSRNAGGREFKTASELNAYITSLNASGGIDGVPLPLVGDDARFSDGFDALDLRLSRRFAVGKTVSLEAIVECFNVFNVTNILGVSRSNYSGFRERAGARQLRALRSRLPALVVLRPRAHHGGRRLRHRRSARLPARSEGAVLSARFLLRARAAHRAAGSRRAGRGRHGGRRHLPHAGRDGPRARRPRARVPGLGVHGRGGALRRAQPRRARGALSGGGRQLRLPAARPTGRRWRSCTAGSACS